MANKITQQKRPGMLTLNRLQAGVVMGFVAISLLLTFGAGFIVGMWYQASEQITPIAAQEPSVIAVEPQAKGQDMTFYSTLTPEAPAKPPPASAPPTPPQVLQNPRVVTPLSTQPVSLPLTKPQEREVHQETSLPQKTPASSPSPALSTSTESGYSVQVGSFRAREEADRLRHRLTQKGYAVWVQPSVVAGQGIWYRVRVGNFPDRATADRTAQRLATQERVSVMVTEESGSR